MNLQKRFHYCHCYFSKNIYIKKYNSHFNFESESHFLKAYENITEEINRRRELNKRASERKKIISENYIPLHHEVYKIQESFFDESFLNLVLTAKTGDYQEVLKLLDVISKEKRLYGFKVLKEDFCLKLLEELNNYENSDLPKERPNTMNKYGILLDDLGFHNFSKVLRTNYLDPLAKSLFPEWRGEELDSHKIFTVTYQLDQDLDLGAHYDNSEVTLNVCLGKCFEGGELYFGDMRQEELSTYTEYTHKIGYGILHRGQQIHGALPITSAPRLARICMSLEPGLNETQWQLWPVTSIYVVIIFTFESQFVLLIKTAKLSQIEFLVHT
ncbi:2-oxoglutarate and iron-dependent oxygenase domain-containing protein 2-like isoform X2 [Uloborus diversus]|uniref:2-oxoglutarate and iron-dependent oxygenase domain-containing protein 2-like isoform X2 n=1 Tax=Uloborus diversus TaxID=327109 RepID=UPI002409E54A|nr:2-oxoglutarate and iron-dependent oxygenase domain-containing protein 2-like isoform X2 [Uloborus diversus]